MPKEETIEMRHVRGVIGENYNLPGLSPRHTLSSKIRALLLKLSGVSQLLHLYGALEVNDTITFAEPNVKSMFSDGTYLYVGFGVDPGAVVKVDLSTFTVVSTLTFNANEGDIFALFSDGTYLYAGCYESPGKIVKIDLATFTQVSTLTLGAGEDSVWCLFSDGTYLYAGLQTAPGKVAKISLETFTQVATVTFAAGELQVYSLWSDGSFLYAGLAGGNIVKVNLSTFAKVSTLATGLGQVYSMFSDGIYLYGGSNNVPGRVSKIDLATFTQSAILVLGVGEDRVWSLFSDGTYLYAGLQTSPGAIVKIDLSTFTQVYTIVLDAGEDNVYTLFSDGTYLYAGLYIIPGKLVRRYLIPTSGLLEKRVELIKLKTDNLPASPSSLTQAQILSDATPFAGASIAAIKAKTDNLPASPSSLTQAQILSDATPFAGASIAAIKAKTDNLPASPSSLTQAQILSDATPFAGADIALIKGYLDTEIAAIKAKTDLMPMAIMHWDAQTNIPTYKAVVGTWAVAASTNYWLNAFLNQSVIAQNNSIALAFFSPDTGAKTLSILGGTASNNGISTILVNGVSQGTLDWYTAVAAYNVMQTISVTPVVGMNILEIKMATKNAGSTNYQIQIEAMSIL